MIATQHKGLPNGWVFPNEKGNLYKGSPLRKVLDAACVACKTKRRVTCHGLRHTANDLLRRVADGEVVRAIIGHSTVAMTHHYSHVDEAEKKIAATRVLAVVLEKPRRKLIRKRGSKRGCGVGCHSHLFQTPRMSAKRLAFGAIAKW
jgi:integrase